MIDIAENLESASDSFREVIVKLKNEGRILVARQRAINHKSNCHYSNCRSLKYLVEQSNTQTIVTGKTARMATCRYRMGAVAVSLRQGDRNTIPNRYQLVVKSGKKHF